MFVLDSHCDTPTQILRSRNLAIDNNNAHVDFPKLRRGKVDGAFFALYIPSSFDSDPDGGFEYAARLLEVTEKAVLEEPGVAAFATSEAEAMANKSNSLFSVFLSLENGSPIGEDMDRLQWFYDRGVRYVTLCHTGNNQICDSCATELKLWGGLSPFGKRLVARMNTLGMLVDVSHISDAAFFDVLECSSKPVVATHSCCRALADHPRNLSDEMIRELASNGGVVQINFYPVFLDSGFNEENMFTLPRPSYKRIVDHIDHVVSIAGIDHVGLGSDFDGIDVTPEGLDDVSFMWRVFDEMRLRGYTDSDISKVAGENLFRIMSL